MVTAKATGGVLGNSGSVICGGVSAGRSSGATRSTKLDRFPGAKVGRRQGVGRQQDHALGHRVIAGQVRLAFLDRGDGTFQAFLVPIADDHRMFVGRDGPGKPFFRRVR